MCAEGAIMPKWSHTKNLRSTTYKIRALTNKFWGDNKFYGDKDKFSGDKKYFWEATKKFPSLGTPKNLRAATVTRIIGAAT
jgi:hypothetical protein